MATTTSSILLEHTERCTVLGKVLACPEAISTIYTVHYRHVLRVCRRFLRRPEDAEDAAAEVFLKLHAVLKQKNESRPFRPWVSQVASRHCIDKLRRWKREKCSSVAGNEIAELPDNSIRSPLSQVLREEERREVKKLLSDLPEHYRVPLVLRYYKQMSYSEIARKLNRRLPAVRLIVFRARNQLRRKLLRTSGEAANLKSPLQSRDVQ